MNQIISKLREIRRLNKLSQSDLSKRTGLPQSHLSNIEKGKIDPRLASLQEISAALGHQLTLVPNHLVPHINALIEGKDLNQRMWQPDELEDSDDA